MARINLSDTALARILITEIQPDGGWDALLAGSALANVPLQTITFADPSLQIKSEGGRWKKDVKQAKISVEGADVQLTKVVLHWDNRSDDTLTDVGVVKAGGQTAPKDAPGRKSRLTAVTVQYKILGDAQTATVKVWGFD